MKKLFLAAAMMSAVNAYGPVADAAPTAPTVTSLDGDAIFCGPSAGTGCEVGADQMIFLEKDPATNLGFGNYGSQTGTPIVDFQSDDGTLLNLDFKNGFSSIDPAKGFASYSGVDVSVPGFLILGMVWQESLTPFSQTSDAFTITANDENPLLKNPTVTAEAANLSDKPDADNEWSVLALKGTAFTDINIQAVDGIDKIRQFELLVEPIPTAAVPEPSTWAMGLMGFALMGAMWRAKPWKKPASSKAWTRAQLLPL